MVPGWLLGLWAAEENTEILDNTKIVLNAIFYVAPGHWLEVMMEFDHFNLFYYRVTPNKMETDMCHCFIICESLLFFFVAMAIALELEHDLQNTAGSLLFSVTFPSTATSLYRPDLAIGYGVCCQLPQWQYLNVGIE